MNITKNQCGLVGYLIVACIAIILFLLAIITVPSFIAYRNNKRVEYATTMCETIRNAVAQYAIDNNRNLFPTLINNWYELRKICNANGGTLKETEKEQGITFLEYVSWDTDEDGEKSDDYYLILRVNGIPEDRTGSQLELRPSGILRQTYS